MERTYIKSPDGFDRAILTMNSTTERDEMVKVFHLNPPSTHCYCIGWDPSAMKLSIQLVPKTKVPAPSPAPSPEEEAYRQELMAMKIEDLRTLAAEMGVDYEPKWNKIATVSAILKKRAGAVQG